MFSSGVMLAMTSAFAAADAIETCLRESRPGAQLALQRFDKVVRHGPRQFSWFIYRITTPTMRDLFMGPRNVLRMKEALLSVLAGDIYGRDADLALAAGLQGALLRRGAVQPAALIGRMASTPPQYPPARRRRHGGQPMKRDAMNATPLRLAQYTARGLAAVRPGWLDGALGAVWYGGGTPPARRLRRTCRWRAWPRRHWAGIPSYARSGTAAMLPGTPSASLPPAGTAWWISARMPRWA
ncbi:hypothetical protein ACU4GD_10825 [Cupriavidus basilensis]